MLQSGCQRELPEYWVSMERPCLNQSDFNVHLFPQINQYFFFSSSVTSQIFSHRNQNVHFFFSNRVFATSFQFNMNLFLTYPDHCILLGAMERKKVGVFQNQCTLSRRIKSPFPVWGKIYIMCFLSCYDDFYHAGVRKYKIICILIYFVSCLSKKNL